MQYQLHFAFRMLIFATLTLSFGSCVNGTKTSDNAEKSAEKNVAATQANFTIEHGSEDAGAGNRCINYVITNTGKHNFKLSGYPSVELLDAHGGQLSTVQFEQVEATYFLSSQQPQNILLAPGGTAYFQIAFSSSSAGNPCPESSQIRIKLPKMDPSITLSEKIIACGDKVKVSALRVGTPD